MPQSQPELEPETRKIILSVLMKWELFLLACVVVIGVAVGVQHDSRSGLRAALLCFLFMQPIFIWVSRDLIRILLALRRPS